MALPLTISDVHTSSPGAVAAAVSGLGTHLPREVVTNTDLERVLETSDDWISSRTGVRERRRAAADESTSDLALHASRAALRDAGVAAETLDAVIVATTTPDHTIPQTAPVVAAGLETQAPAFDVGAGCTGFVYGLAVAAAMTGAGIAGRVLLVGAETLSRFVDDTDRETAVIFGDGAGAVVIEGGGDAHLGPFDLGSDGALADLLIVPAGGARRPADRGTVEAGGHHLRMSGREVYRQAVNRMVGSSRRVLAQADLDATDVDLFVGHQANARILEAVSRRLGMPEDRALIVLDRVGNTSAASIPLALEEARRRGRLDRGTRILLTAFGAGLTWGSCLLTWGEGSTDV